MTKHDPSQIVATHLAEKIKRIEAERDWLNQQIDKLTKAYEEAVRLASGLETKDDEE